MTNSFLALSGVLQKPPDSQFPEYSVPQWYAIHTFAHHERKVEERLRAKNLSTFLPLYSVRRIAKDASTPQLEKPLFPGYLFVFIPLLERLRVLQVAGVVKLVGACGKATPVPEQEIDSLRKARAMGIQAEPHIYLEVGRKVRVKEGPFEGFQGILLRHKGKYRVVLALELIASAFVIEVDSAILEPVRATHRFRTATENFEIPSTTKKGQNRDAISMGGIYVSP